MLKDIMDIYNYDTSQILSIKLKSKNSFYFTTSDCNNIPSICVFNPKKLQDTHRLSKDNFIFIKSDTIDDKIHKRLSDPNESITVSFPKQITIDNVYFPGIVNILCLHIDIKNSSLPNLENIYSRNGAYTHVNNKLPSLKRVIAQYNENYRIIGGSEFIPKRNKPISEHTDKYGYNNQTSDLYLYDLHLNSSNWRITTEGGVSIIHGKNNDNLKVLEICDAIITIKGIFKYVNKISIIDSEVIFDNVSFPSLTTLYTNNVNDIDFKKFSKATKITIDSYDMNIPLNIFRNLKELHIKYYEENDHLDSFIENVLPDLNNLTHLTLPFLKKDTILPSSLINFRCFSDKLSPYNKQIYTIPTIRIHNDGCTATSITINNKLGTRVKNARK